MSLIISILYSIIAFVAEVSYYCVHVSASCCVLFTDVSSLSVDEKKSLQLHLEKDGNMILAYTMHYIGA